jgi:hypothetical protein
VSKRRQDNSLELPRLTSPVRTAEKGWGALNLFQLLGLRSLPIAAVWATEHHALKTSQNVGLASNLG